MTPDQILLLFQFINMGIDTLSRLEFLISKIMTMTPEELKAHNEKEELRSDLLMLELDTI
jgi:hypothetical protein